jgi:SAM-dependent methyltransferase
MSDYAQTHARRFAVTGRMIPLATGGRRCLEIGHEGHFDAALSAAGWTDVLGANWNPDIGTDTRNFDAQKPWPLQAEAFDLVLCCEVLEHLDKDPMCALAEANRVLRHGGMLLLTTPNICSARGLDAMMKGYAPYLFASFSRRFADRHAIEYDVHTLSAMLHAAGFDATISTRNVWGVAPEIPADAESAHRGDCFIVTATKAGPVRDRFPAAIYHD